MIKDTPDGQTHYENDGCGEPAHNSPCKSCEILARHGKTALLHTCGKSTCCEKCKGYTTSKGEYFPLCNNNMCSCHVQPCTIVPEREEKTVCTNPNHPVGSSCSIWGCGKNPLSEKQEAEGLGSIESIVVPFIRETYSHFAILDPKVGTLLKKGALLLTKFLEGRESSLLTKTRKEAFNEGYGKGCEDEAIVQTTNRASDIKKAVAKREEEIRGRLENILASKYEGVPRMNELHERAILNVFDDRNFEAKENRK